MKFSGGEKKYNKYPPAFFPFAPGLQTGKKQYLCTEKHTKAK